MKVLWGSAIAAGFMAALGLIAVAPAADAGTPDRIVTQPRCGQSNPGVSLGDYMAACGRQGPYTCARVDGVSDDLAALNERQVAETLRRLRSGEEFTLFLPSDAALNAAAELPMTRQRAIMSECGAVLAQVTTPGRWSEANLLSLNGFIPTIRDGVVAAPNADPQDWTRVTNFIRRINGDTYQFVSNGQTRSLDVNRMGDLGITPGRFQNMIYVNDDRRDVGLGNYDIQRDQWLSGARIDSTIEMQNGLIHFVDCMIGITCPTAPR